MESAPLELRAFSEAASVAEAERALDSLAQAGTSSGLGDLYDELAEEAAEQEDLDAAIRLQRKAIDFGCKHLELAREMLAWYMLKNGETAAAEALFDQLRVERGPDDPELLLLIGNAHSDAGHLEEAHAAFDEALAAAKSLGDPGVLDRVRAERRYCRLELGLDFDGEDRLAPAPGPLSEAPEEWALAWFPREEHRAALSRWPDLEEELRDADAYCRRMERELRELQRGLGKSPLVAPLHVEELIAFAEREGLDPGEGTVRSRYAAELARLGNAVRWPPGRAESCWCGSGRKYKRCCGAA